MKQTVTTIQEASGEINCGAGQLADAADKLATACTHQAGPVSYTHLDVYKRQDRGKTYYAVSDASCRCYSVYYYVYQAF